MLQYNPARLLIMATISFILGHPHGGGQSVPEISPCPIPKARIPHLKFPNAMLFQPARASQLHSLQLMLASQHAVLLCYPPFFCPFVGYLILIMLYMCILMETVKVSKPFSPPCLLPDAPIPPFSVSARLSIATAQPPKYACLTCSTPVLLALAVPSLQGT